MEIKTMHRIQAVGVGICLLGILLVFLICGQDIRCVSFEKDILFAVLMPIGIIVFIASVWAEVKERERIELLETS